MDSIEGLVLTPVKIIRGEAGSVMHALKQTDSTFNGFGEAYFSTVDYQSWKGWKRHIAMILNIVVPQGAVQFVLYDGRERSKTYKNLIEVTLSPENYLRLTVPPGIWMAFKGDSKGVNLLMNVASIPHDPKEGESLPLMNDVIPYKILSL